MRRSRSAHTSEGSPVVEVVMSTTAPFDGPGLLRFFAARAVPGVEEVEADTYRRTVGDGVIELRVLDETVELRVHGDVPGAEAHGRALLDLDADPGAIRERLGTDAVVGPLVAE